MTDSTPPAGLKPAVRQAAALEDPGPDAEGRCEGRTLKMSAFRGETIERDMRKSRDDVASATRAKAYGARATSELVKSLRTAAGTGHPRPGPARAQEGHERTVDVLGGAAPVRSPIWM